MLISPNVSDQFLIHAASCSLRNQSTFFFSSLKNSYRILKPNGTNRIVQFRFLFFCSFFSRQQIWVVSEINVDAMFELVNYVRSSRSTFGTCTHRVKLCAYFWNGGKCTYVCASTWGCYQRTGYKHANASDNRLPLWLKHRITSQYSIIYPKAFTCFLGVAGMTSFQRKLSSFFFRVVHYPDTLTLLIPLLKLIQHLKEIRRTSNRFIIGFFFLVI